MHPPGGVYEAPLCALVEFPAVNIADFELAFADGLQSGVPDQSVITIRNPKSPIEKVVESAGNAPASACLQGRCIACLPRPLGGFTIYEPDRRLVPRCDRRVNRKS